MSAALDLREAAAALRPALLRSPELDALVPAAIATWRGRMINEHGSARVFEALADQLAGLGLAREADEARGFADEERRHGVLCGAVVEALGGSAYATIDEPEPIPLHEDVPPLEAMLRNLLSICCLSETVAVALIGAERLEMPEGELHTLLGRILADEVGHSRFGWR
ncbi:MAG TPA: ferritin-like domain-containing protein, partial [Nannocystaceae bacterium]|nr:ferritin-like domain-containing protein [Nannocystaceae bacterium]